MKQRYLSFDHAFLAVERQQLLDEGRDLAPVTAEFDALQAADLDAEPGLQGRAAALLDACAGLPMRAGYAYDEPSDLAGIRRARPAETPFWIVTDPGDDYLFDHVLGAWLGRCAGCLLGKPVEGWRSPAMWGFLKDQGLYPLADFFRSDAPAELYDKYHVSRERAYIDRVTHMPEDDDTNYTITGLAIMQQRGPGFAPEDVANFWLQNIPIFHTFTAERVAYRNFVNLIPPPASAAYRNPYREWIGAQIRADFWGYAALGNPELAAEYAWRDASISHVKNGIYGEMLVAAMIAAAFALDDPRQIVEAALAEIPVSSRLYQDMRRTVDICTAHRNDPAQFEAVLDAIYAEFGHYHPVHTNNNAALVVAAVLLGGHDFEKVITISVMGGWDTDCNGATAGSIAGAMLGAKALPEKWIAPLHDTLNSAIIEYHPIAISECARRSVEIARKAP
jgi:ADP-ribosylglycohydrolase